MNNNKSVHDENDAAEDGLDPSLDHRSSPDLAVNDVVCGKSKFGQMMNATHPGNIRFRKMVQARQEEYRKAYHVCDRTQIVTEILQKLRRGATPTRYDFTSIHRIPNRLYGLVS